MKIGNILNQRYEIKSKIKDGGMGSVYQVFDNNLGRLCVLKQLSLKQVNPNQLSDFTKSFQREAKLLANLDHARLPRVTDYFSNCDNYFLIMDFVQGKDLEEVIQTKNFTENEIVDIGRQICELLIYLHSQQPPVIYRDLKPANIMINGNNQIKVIDFGIARKINDQMVTQKIDQKQTIIGTPGFAPIEQYRGLADHRSDIYSLGMTMYYLLTKTLPNDPLAIKPLSSFVHLQIKPELLSIIEKAIDSRPPYRYQSATDMKNELEKYFNHDSISPKTTLAKSSTSIDYYLLIINLILKEFQYKGFDIEDLNETPRLLLTKIKDIKQLYSREGTRREGMNKLLNLIDHYYFVQLRPELFLEIKRLQFLLWMQQGKYSAALQGFRKLLKEDQSEENYEIISELELKLKNQKRFYFIAICFYNVKLFQWFLIPWIFLTYYGLPEAVSGIFIGFLLQLIGYTNFLWGEKIACKHNSETAWSDLIISIIFLIIYHIIF